MPAARPFLRYPDKRLSAVAGPVAAVDATVEALWEEMLQAMYDMPGVGLAAPQLGVSLRVIVVDATAPGAGRRPIRLANPELVETGDKTVTYPEGSPNLPGITADVTRPSPVLVRGLGPDGPAEHRLVDLWAASVQHQIDHLDGKLFIDRLGPVKRRMLLTRYAKQARKGR